MTKEEMNERLNLIRQLGEISGWITMTMHCDCHVTLDENGRLDIFTYVSEDDNAD